MSCDVSSEILFYVMPSHQPGACERHASLEDALLAAERLTACGHEVRVVSRKCAVAPMTTEA
jgi:hypothetical protein